MSFKPSTLACCAASAFLAASCTGLPAKPIAQEATASAPPAWRATASASVGPQTAVSLEWWEAFGDPALSAAVMAAVDRNVDVGTAEARVREAEALARQARSTLSPSLDAVASGQRARTLTAFGQPSESSSVQIEGAVSYEVDLWGRLRNGDAAARARLQASQFSRDAVALSVASATARAYVGLLSLDAQLEVARQTLVSRDGALRLATRRAEMGDTSRLELSQAQSEQLSAAAQIPLLEVAVARQENALRLLTGDTPGAVMRGRLEALTLPAPSPGLASSLLERRPDIAQAQASLAASNATYAASRAALLPQVQLTGSLGELFAEGLDPLTIWNVGGSVLAPLFDGGRRSAVVEADAARRDQAAWAYRGVVLNAFIEVEDALEGVARQSAQAAATNAQLASAQDALTHARNRYRAGYASYLEELDAQRGLLVVEISRIRLREERLRNAISLYQSLGGGWERQPQPEA